MFLGRGLVVEGCCQHRESVECTLVATCLEEERRKVFAAIVEFNQKGNVGPKVSVVDNRGCDGIGRGEVSFEEDPPLKRRRHQYSARQHK